MRAESRHAASRLANIVHRSCLFDNVHPGDISILWPHAYLGSMLSFLSAIAVYGVLSAAYQQAAP